jgi:hypothetical protein
MSSSDGLLQLGERCIRLRQAWLAHQLGGGRLAPPQHEPGWHFLHHRGSLVQDFIRLHPFTHCRSTLDALPRLVLHHLPQHCSWRWSPHYLDPVLACREDMETICRRHLLAQTHSCPVQYLRGRILWRNGHCSRAYAMVDHLVCKHDTEGEVGCHDCYEHGCLVRKPLGHSLDV